MSKERNYYFGNYLVGCDQKQQMLDGSCWYMGDGGTSADHLHDAEASKVKIEDVLFLYYDKKVYAYGIVKKKHPKNNGKTTIEVEKWRYEDKNGISYEGLIARNAIGNTRLRIFEVNKDFGEQIIKDLKGPIQVKHEEDMNNYVKILKHKKQIILQGAPGTGKTYISADIAMKLIDEEEYEKKDYENDRKALMDAYNKKVESEQIAFTTFHQSLDYEEFVEGFKPKEKDGKMIYKVEPGIFKKMCKKAKDDLENKYILIIDEINRGNISKILGELITLLESDKRTGEKNKIQVTLPYSKDENNENEKLSVPPNLYIIATMNTADRSIGHIDYAVRRRFAFITLLADENKIQNENGKALFRKVKAIFNKENINSELKADDLMVGHSYFMAKDKEKLEINLEYEIKPLLLEYVKDGVLVGENLEGKINNLSI